MEPERAKMAAKPPIFASILKCNILTRKKLVFASKVLRESCFEIFLYREEIYIQNKISSYENNNTFVMPMVKVGCAPLIQLYMIA